MSSDDATRAKLCYLSYGSVLLLLERFIGSIYFRQRDVASRQESHETLECLMTIARSFRVWPIVVLALSLENLLFQLPDVDMARDLGAVCQSRSTPEDPRNPCQSRLTSKDRSGL